MKIAFIDIQNFRKLKSCRVEFSQDKTIFVGANNSGKTSAMDALMVFLKASERDNLSSTDFTLSNWKAINQLATDWIANENPDIPSFNLDAWQAYMPSIDVWLDVEDNEVHYVSHIIPTLDWDGGELGVRLSFEPKNLEKLHQRYKEDFEASRKITEKNENLRLWPQSMQDFLGKRLHNFFEVKAYILDPSKKEEETQKLPENSEPVDGKPFKGLLKIDIINAQRGFSDPHSKDGGTDNDKRLSTQLRHYFDKHLNPSTVPNEDDIEALEAIEAAKTAFDSTLKASFEPSLGELENLNYPGFSDPQIQISSKVNPIKGLDHDAAIQFNVLRDEGGTNDLSLCLPEKYNGLGYQNLISMIFKLIRYRDEWMQVGKVGKRAENQDDLIEPLHIVLVEEPEAHLHAQVQQVFIKKSYDVLRDHDDLKENLKFSTQLVISTHSSHVAHESDFKNLRYFKRMSATRPDTAPYAEVVSLSTVFGGGSDTAKFATRYLKTTHCDLFFADAAILVEGPAERMLVPYFVKNEFPDLDQGYISLLEIGGSHAHKLKPLIEKLGLLTLVITDLDSIEKIEKINEETGKTKTSYQKVLPQRGREYLTGNSTIKTWIPTKQDLDAVLDASSTDKIKDNFVRVAYQYEIKLKFSDEEKTVIPYTFEDALVLSNINFFKGKENTKGLMKKMVDAVNEKTASKACFSMFDALGTSSKKAEMALELLFISDPKNLKSPEYIKEGLKWLQERLKNRHQDYLLENNDENGDDNDK